MRRRILVLLTNNPPRLADVLEFGGDRAPLAARSPPMDRNNPWKALRSLRKGGRSAQGGRFGSCFPEGTRTPNGEIQEFKTALFILPIRSRIPVVPVLIEGTFQALKRGSILLNPVPLKLTFYDPIPASGLIWGSGPAYLCGEGPSRTFYLYGWDNYEELRCSDGTIN